MTSSLFLVRFTLSCLFIMHYITKYILRLHITLHYSPSSIISFLSQWSTTPFTLWFCITLSCLFIITNYIRLHITLVTLLPFIKYLLFSQWSTTPLAFNFALHYILHYITQYITIYYINIPSWYLFFNPDQANFHYAGWSSCNTLHNM